MPRIAVVGSLNMDLVVRAPRFARPGETITGDLFLTIPGGKGANQAVAAQRLGGQVAMIGCVGEDAFGAALRQGLAEEGIDVTAVDVRGGLASGVALITVDGSGENSIVVVPGANGTLADADIMLAAPQLTAARVLLLQLEVPVTAVTLAAQVASESGAIVVLNAAPASPVPDALLALVDYLVVNETELFSLAGPEASDLAQATAHLRQRGARSIVVTLGAAGARLLRASGAESMVRAYPVDVVDSTAAGDAFVGALAVALAEGASDEVALRRGNAAGAIAVTRSGAQPSLPTRGELDAWLREGAPPR
ncbi:ribokinase [Luteitalea sp. TBR-22]|uniref:ribokinase n=1 Tax=Luteitalea sp. TBR-22 TaxID=2802971 RepID=UPI001AF7047F|nr:ribokinase [Luteitalea sp. TBR-22]BCS31839.1 ribokinase [Luteitalea sp. TBR-22]